MILGLNYFSPEKKKYGQIGICNMQHPLQNLCDRNSAEGWHECLSPSSGKLGFRHITCVKCVAVMCADGKNTYVRLRTILLACMLCRSIACQTPMHGLIHRPLR